jgi:transcriptional regulator with XRE-family HTH domain
MIAGAQIRSARALLGISGEELSKLSGVSWATIQRYESTNDVPSSRSGTLERVMAALEAQGIEFIGNPLTSPGVQLNPQHKTTEPNN